MSDRSTEASGAADGQRSSDYQPVACGFYDEVGLRMMSGRPCTIVFETGGAEAGGAEAGGAENEAKTVEARITDVTTEPDGEYAHLSTGRTIRLDRIRRIDDVERG
jgi:transcriptional antiterminator Rof (Rho-off)